MNYGDYDFIKSASQMFNPQQERPKEWYEELEDKFCSLCPAMTYTQRLIGCFSCILIGFLLSMGSLLRLMQLIAGNPTPFATIYTIGNIISISATCFLFGPLAQAKSMCATTRIVTTSLYFFFMFTTLLLAFYPNYIPARVLWLVIAISCQFAALLWYNVSYIPYAREVIATACQNSCRSILPQYCTSCDDRPNSNTPGSGYF